MRSACLNFSFICAVPFSGNHPTLALLDEELKSMLCQILNVDLDDRQWDQASLPVKCGGLGIRKPTHVAPSAFLASVAGTSSLVSSILSHRQCLVVYQGETDALTMWSTLGGGTPPSGPFVPHRNVGMLRSLRLLWIGCLQMPLMIIPKLDF